jgi:transcriptional regulator with XRE-family HTH domain
MLRLSETMKREITICSSLGFTQLEMAMLLNISRSNWALYETGKRGLPLSARLLLAEMLSHQHANQKAINSKKQPTSIQVKRQQSKLGQMLIKNEYQHALLLRKKAAIEKKQQLQSRRSELVGFLQRRHSDTEKTASALHKNVIDYAAQTSDTDYLTVLMEYELQLELLQHEKKWIESKLLELE